MILTGFYNDIFYLKNDMWFTGYDTILKSIFSKISFAIYSN